MAKKDVYKLDEKRIITNMVATLGATLSNSFINFILMIYIVRTIGHDGNGVYQTTSSLFAYLVLAEGGISVIFKQKAYEAMGKKKYKQVNSILVSFKNLYKKISICYIFLMIAIAISYPFAAPSNVVNREMMFIILMIVFVKKLFYILLSAPTSLAMNLYEMDYLKNILSTVLSLISTIAIMLVLTFANTSIEMTILYMVSIITTRSLIHHLFIYNYRKKIKWLDLKVKAKEINLSDLKYQYTSTISDLVVNSTDTITISIILGFAQASVYGIYIVVLTGVKSIVNPIINVLQVVVGKHIGVNSPKLESFKLLNFMTVNIAGLSFICTTLLINNFLHLSFGRYIPENDVYALIFGAFLMYIISVRSLTIIMQVTGKFKFNAQISIIEAAANITLSIIFINLTQDIKGAIYATLITSAFKYIALLLYCSIKVIENNVYSVLLQVFRTWLPTVVTAVFMLLTFSKVTDHLDMSRFMVFLMVFIATPIVACISIFITTLIFDNKTAKTFYRYIPVLKTLFKKA